MYVFLVLFTFFDFYHEHFKQKLEKNILSEICTFGRSAGVWSGSALFAYVPQKMTLGLYGLNLISKDNHIVQMYMSRDMRFHTLCNVQPAKAQINLCIRTV